MRQFLAASFPIRTRISPGNFRAAAAAAEKFAEFISKVFGSPIFVPLTILYRLMNANGLLAVIRPIAHTTHLNTFPGKSLSLTAFIRYTRRFALKYGEDVRKLP